MLSDEDRVRELARLVGIEIAEEELAEVTNRFGSLMSELERLKELDLSGIQPVTIFPEQE
jgi:Asp-tRNA(Asn)/Glu-tRNA(Gln) amidotransferase C subunit